MTSIKRILFFMLLASSAVQAQLADSLFLKQNSFYAPLQNQLWETPLFFTSQKLSDFTQIQIDFAEKNTPLKRIQSAHKTTEYGFQTQGIFNIKPKLRLFGDFNFNKNFEKGIGYNLSSERTDNQNVLAPNYFFAPRKGNWEGQNYSLNGGFSYEFDNHLLLSLTAFYENKKLFRTIDPRPQVTSSNYGGEIHAGYILKNHRIFGSVGRSRNSEKSSILYVDDSQNAPAYPETFTRFSNGYGRIIFNSSYTGNMTVDRNENFGAGYQYQNNKNSISLAYKYNKSMDDFYGRDANGKIYIEKDLIQFKYRLVSHETKLNYFYDGDKTDYKLQLKYTKDQGDNYSVAERGQNYRMNLEKLSFQAGLIKKENDRVLYSFEITGNYAQHKYVDLLGRTNKKLNAFEAEASFNRDILVLKNNRLNLALSFQNYSALDEALLYVPITNSNYFAENVVIPDHAFDITSKLQSKIVAQHYISLPKKRTLRIFANYAALFALDKKYEAYVSDFENKNNTYLNAGISINY